MTVLPWIIANERVVGRNSPLYDDVANRPLRAALSMSGYGPDVDFSGLYGPVINVLACGATGDGSDDFAGIREAQDRHNATGWPVYFPTPPSGAYHVSDYIDVTTGTTWLGGTSAFGYVGVKNILILATGANKGVLRFRPGPIGDSLPTYGNGLTVKGILFGGDATTGHLVMIARIIRARFDHVAFLGTTGLGLKDDLSTQIAAAGIHMYAVEIADFNCCSFENMTSLHDNGGAGMLPEKNVHMVNVHNGHLNGNTIHVRFLDGDNGVWSFSGGTDFNQGGTCFYADIGDVYDLSVANCWAEYQTGILGTGNTATVGKLMTFSGAILSRIINWERNNLTGGNVDGDAFAFGAAPIGFVAERNLIQNYVSVINMTPHASACGNRLRGNYYNGNTQTSFIPLAQCGFVELDGDASVTGVGVSCEPNVILTDGATVTINPQRGCHFVLSTANSRTMAIPTGLSGFGNPQLGYDGYEYDVTIVNTSGGAIVTTWNGHFVFSTAWADPAAGKRRTVKFRFDAAADKSYEIAHGGDM